MMNQQLANQISAATSAKQAQLRAIQQGMQNRNKNKPVSTVEPFQRQAAVAAAAVQAAVVSAGNDNADDPKYQTLPYNTKFQPGNNPGNNAVMIKKIEALKAEKENNNLDSDLPSPPPQIPRQQPRLLDHQGNYDNDNR